jgi:hypothetical protein
MAKGVRELSGGHVDMAPQQIKLVHNYFNPATEAYAFVRDLFGDREPKYAGEVVNPIYRRFTGGATGFYDQDKFDELLAKSKQARYLAEQGGIDKLSPEQQVLARSSQMLSKVDSDISSLFKNSKLMTQERRAQLQERAREMLLGGIKRYNDMRDRTIRRQ